MSEKIEENPQPLFTRSRILLLIIIFLVVSMPILYRNLDFLLK